MRATGLGRIALVLLYDSPPERARLYLREAQQVHLRQPWIGAWLCAIDAELLASIGNTDGFMKTMETSKTILAGHPVDTGVYASLTRFNGSMQLGFEGAGFLRLKQPHAAVLVLHQSLSSLPLSSSRRRSTLLTDIGMGYALQGEMKEVCTYFHQALDITAQTKALLAFQRIYLAQSELDQWKHDSEMKALYTHMTTTARTIRRTKHGDVSEGFPS